MSGHFKLAVRSQFSAAHALRHYKGKCENIHGHNFDVEVVVRGTELDPQTGMLIDFGILKAGLAHVLARLDHRLLNETPPFDVINPSSEHLARTIAQEMAAFLDKCDDPQAANVRLAAVSVSEKATQTATWAPEI